MATSALVWLAVASFAPAVMAALMLAAAGIVAGWRTGWMVRCRIGARATTKEETSAVLRMLVPVVVLRGRNQPSLWASDRLGHQVAAIDERTLVVGGRLLGQIRDCRIADLAVCEMAVRALALAPVQRCRIVATAELFCLPWKALAFITRPVHLLARRLRPLVWLFALLAAGDLYRRGEWLPIVLLVLVVVATVTTPRFDRAWAARSRAMADDAARRHLPCQTPEPTSGGIGGRPPAPPMPTRERGLR